jgi:hypothetical protein
MITVKVKLSEAKLLQEKLKNIPDFAKFLSRLDYSIYEDTFCEACESGKEPFKNFGGLWCHTDDTWTRDSYFCPKRNAEDEK